MSNGIGAVTMVAAAPPESSWPVRSPPTSAIVIALGVAQIFGWGSSYYLLGALTQPIAAETAWSETWILAGLSLSLLIAGTISPRMGQAVAERGGRNLLAASTLLLAAGLVILANSHAQIVYLVGWMVMGLGMGLGLYDAAFATLGRHFGEASRGPITALTLIAGFSSTVTWPLSLFFLGQVGWRGTCIAYAVIEVALCLPLYLLFAPSIARTARTEPVGAALSNRSPPRDRTYYILGAILTLIAAVNTVVSVNLILILTSFGVPYATAVGLATLLGPSQSARTARRDVFGPAVSSHGDADARDRLDSDRQHSPRLRYRRDASGGDSLWRRSRAGLGRARNRADGDLRSQDIRCSIGPTCPAGLDRTGARARDRGIPPSKDRDGSYAVDISCRIFERVHSGGRARNPVTHERRSSAVAPYRSGAVVAALGRASRRFAHAVIATGVSISNSGRNWRCGVYTRSAAVN